MNKIKSFGVTVARALTSRRFALVAVCGAVLGLFGAPPAGAVDEISTAITTAGTYISAAVGASIIFVLFMVGRRFLSKV